MQSFPILLKLHKYAARAKNNYNNLKKEMNLECRNFHLHLLHINICF